jgi:hypothetical protein
MAELRREQRRFREATSLARQALAIFEQHFPAGHTRISEAQIVLGSALVENGLAAEAVPLLGSALESREASLPSDAIPIAEARVWLGVALLRSGDTAAGRALLESATASYEAAGRPGEREAIRARRELGGPPATDPPSGERTIRHPMKDGSNDRLHQQDLVAHAGRAPSDQRMRR